MSDSNRYVIFYCDDCDLLIPAIAVFKKFHPGITVHTSSDGNDLASKIKVQMPELILMYLQNPEKSYISVVKKIRKSIGASSIPVVVYHELPNEEELQRAFQQIV